MQTSQEKYYTKEEVELHNAPDDCWLSWNGKVYDLTRLVQENNDSILTRPILQNAGKDISHWFDKNGKTQINPLTECETIYTPAGRFLHVPPPLPRADWVAEPCPWWMDTRLCIGRLTSKARKIRLINLLTKDEHVLQVCSEDKLSVIQERYGQLNAHCKGYMWKRLGKLLDMSLTLQENGIVDESNSFQELGMDEDDWLPAIHLYYR